MSDEQQVGPPMLVLTDALRRPKVRVGHIGGNLTLPRTLPLAALLVGAGGGVFGLLIGFVIIGGVGPTLYATVLGAGAGVFIVTWSPLKGESLAKWFGLRVSTRRKILSVNGEPVQLAVGIARLGEVTTGDIRLKAGAVTIPPSQYDERGVPIDAELLFSKLLEDSGTHLPEQSPVFGQVRSLEDDHPTGGYGTQQAFGGRRAMLESRAEASVATPRVLTPLRGAPPVYTEESVVTPVATTYPAEIVDTLADSLWDTPVASQSDHHEGVSGGARFGAPVFGSAVSVKEIDSPVETPENKVKSTIVDKKPDADGWVKVL
jgi:hypothetical protein